MAHLLQALKDEMVLRCDYITLPDTLYIGGGTPSLYRAEELGGLIEEAKKVWGCEFKEITVELNPEDVTHLYCRALADYGVNRLSVGIQSFFDEHLRFMNRRHNAAQGIKAIEAARNVGFQNISIDLIFGFPGLTVDQWRQNIEYALQWEPEHLSAYQLGIEPGTPFYKRYQEGLLQPVAQEEAADQYALMQGLLQTAGLIQYEVSNFARERYGSQHNSAYWQGACYLGVGPSAHSFNGVARHANVRSLWRYLKGITEGRLAVSEERITPRKRYNEFVMTRLRTVKGFSRKELEKQNCSKNLQRHFEQASARLFQQGLLTEQDGYIAIVPSKLFIMDRIVMELML